MILTPAFAGVFLVAIQKPTKLDRRFEGEVEQDQRYAVLK
ncbi:hypothetical protein SSYIS1_00330 [Serratia symbiotica]|uniref:Uncharacterized protein n=1 Tax=Serratia symbiotica TaxID=138074 RepID=A0A455VHD4_9GAMM|nr:hypothetical protein SSYIS1_00330 [Serratia symbiotica]